jgi:hypothetical protein
MLLTNFSWIAGIFTIKIFEYEVDESGKTAAKAWEWK